MFVLFTVHKEESKEERSRRNVLQSKIKVKRYWRVNLFGLDADLFNQCLGVNSELV